MRITFVGSGKDFERRQVTAAGWEYYALPCRPLPRGPREAVSFLMENFAGYLAAKRFTRDEEVTLVVGLGGYASVPMGRAAVKCRVPLVLLEQNVLPGRATRWLAPAASLICTSFPQTGLQLRHRSTVRLTGNPIRRIGTAAKDGRLSSTSSLYTNSFGVSSQTPSPSAPLPEGEGSNSWLSSSGSGEIRQLLVLGGSGGARSLNENVPRTLQSRRVPCPRLP